MDLWSPTLMAGAKLVVSLEVTPETSADSPGGKILVKVSGVLEDEVALATLDAGLITGGIGRIRDGIKLEGYPVYVLSSAATDIETFYLLRDNEFAGTIPNTPEVSVRKPVADIYVHIASERSVIDLSAESELPKIGSPQGVIGEFFGVLVGSPRFHSDTVGAWKVGENVKTKLTTISFVSPRVSVEGA